MPSTICRVRVAEAPGLPVAPLGPGRWEAPHRSRDTPAAPPLTASPYPARFAPCRRGASAPAPADRSPPASAWVAGCCRPSIAESGWSALQPAPCAARIPALALDLLLPLGFSLVTSPPTNSSVGLRHVY